MSQDDRRRARRRRFRGSVEVLEEVRGRTGVAMARDISVRGMFLQTLSPWEIGDRVSIRFLLPSSSSYLVLEGIVVRVQRPSPEVPPEDVGAALTFEGAEEWVIQEVDRYVARAARLEGVVSDRNESSG
ncbi:MAG TPA: PilZ domain-containing protein [Myxococcota bacterium]|nr:PilZ domain-containing protein [Myxococcota bacterium]HQK49880.1 PilZ domain-containing protein [Myxococcota bacterium]